MSRHISILDRYGRSTMLKACNFSTIVYQATIFTPDTSTFSDSKFLATILGKYAHHYNGSVQALPLPTNIPPEIPRVILQSSNGAFRLEASPARVNSLFIQSVELPAGSEDLFDKICVEVLEHYVQETETPVNRLAMLLTRVYKTENPAQLLIERFCKAELQSVLFERSENFEIHNHKLVRIKDFSINSWIRCKTGTLNFSNNSVPGVIVDQDLNTLTTEIEQPKFTFEDIRSYFHQVLPEAQNVLQLYFPD